MLKVVRIAVVLLVFLSAGQMISGQTNGNHGRRMGDGSVRFRHRRVRTPRRPHHRRRSPRRNIHPRRQGLRR
jgi:hypothetical protein